MTMPLTEDTQIEPQQPARGWVLIVIPIVSFVVLAILIAAAFVAYLMSRHVDLSGNQVAAIASGLVTNVRILIAIGIAQYVVMMFFIWLFVPKRGPRALARYFPPVPWKTVGWIALGGIAFALGTAGLQWTLDHFGVIKFQDRPQDLIFQTRGLLQLAEFLLLGSVLAPLVEEIYFRGLFLSWLRAKMPLIAAAIINAAVFSLIHGYFAIHPGADGWFESAGIVALALIMIALVVRTGSLWSSIAFHAAYNGAAVIFGYVALNS